MRVNIEFDRPFYGMIFSKGFYSDSHCVHLKPGTGHLSATFEIFLNSCGMSSSANHAVGGVTTPSGSYVENTIIIQYDPYVQEVWDQARKLRCTWYDFYEKAVTFRPFQVDMLHAVTANFLGDNLQCWMQIQVGKGPWASEVSGIVKIGQTMTMVLAIKDDENKFDMLVRNCVAHDGKRAPIQLVDQHGCVVRPKIMSKFQKIKNFGPSASVVSFAYFQAFKFPDSMNVHFQCVIQVCRYNCPEPRCAGHGATYQTVKRKGTVSEEGGDLVTLGGRPRSVEVFPDDLRGARRRRDVVLHVYKREAQDMTDVNTSRTIQVVAPGDVNFALNAGASTNETVVVSQKSMDSDHICISLPSFVAGLAMLLAVLVVACLVAAFLFVRVRSLDAKGMTTTYVHGGFDPAEFVKVTS
ncbi:hypothetical protein WDU94_005396 [Cyamophila willieti]